jgi:hypothetical protein
MGNRASRYKKNYLAKGDFEPPIKATISQVVTEDVQEDEVTVFYLANPSSPLDTTRGVIINGTNWDTVAVMHGRDPQDPTINDQDWIGTEIVLFNDPNVMYGPKKTGGVRVRAPQSLAPAQVEEPPPPSMPVDVPF